jgi:nucleotide-binding universal stress UspA family protein
MEGEMQNKIMQQVLWATDFSEISILALKATRFLGSMPHQLLLALHCIDDPLNRIYKPEETSTVNMLNHAREISKKNLNDLFSELGIPEDKYKTIIKVGKASEKILDVAEEEKVISIIMGKESKGLERILGSVSEFVLNNAKCPVLIVGSDVKAGWLKIN